MIKERDLRDFHSRIGFNNEGGDTLDLSAVQSILTQEIKKYAVPVIFCTDEVKTGGFFNSGTEKCLVLSHPDHQKDYNKICIRLKTQGTFVFLTFYEFGNSMWRMQQATLEEATEMSHGKLSDRLAASIARGSVNSSKLQDEIDWYSIINQIIDDVFC